MSILDQIQTTAPGAPRITLYGKQGVGKSTLASQFPDPLFLLTEDNYLTGIKALPIFEDFEQLWASISELLMLDNPPFKTIVLDSISKLDQLVIKRTLQQSPPAGKDKRQPETLAEAWGGYGAGFEKAASLHRALKSKLDKFKDKGISVVYISHLEIKNYKSPEEEDYNILSIVMNGDKSRQVYIDDVDLVGYCKIKSHLIETESGRNLVKSTGKRIMHVGANDANVSKNRFAMPDEIDMSFDSIKKYIKFYE